MLSVKGWDRHLWLGVCSHNIWNWKINWTLNYLKVLLELVKTLLRSQIGHLCQTENSRFFPNYHEETNSHFLNNMVAGLGKPQSVQWEESFLFFFLSPGNTALISLCWSLSHSGRSPAITGLPPSSHVRRPGLRGRSNYPRWEFSLSLLGLSVSQDFSGTFPYHTAWVQRDLKLKQHTFFCKENKFKLKIVRHVFLSLGDLGYSPCQFRPCWSCETWLSGLCLSFRTTPCLFLTSCPLPVFTDQHIFCFIITRDLQLAITLKVSMKNTSQKPG